jgi:hypothetical protein
MVLAYLMMLASKASADRAIVLSALLCSAAVTFSPLYDIFSQVGYYCAFSMIYIAAANKIVCLKITSALVIMSFFQLLMAIDSYANPKTETWIYINFEEITLFIHFVIISSCTRIRTFGFHGLLGRIINSLRGLAYDKCLAPAL